MDEKRIEQLCARAKNCRIAGDRAEAAALLRDIVKCDPERVEALNNLGLLLVESGETAEAITHLEAAIRLAPEKGALHCNIADALQSEGRLEEARRHYLRAIALDPSLVEAHLGLGTLYHFHGGNLAEAKRLYEEVLRLRPDNARAHYLLGGIMRAWDRLDLAAICFSNTLRFLPDHANTLVNLGETLQASGRIGESIECLRRAVFLEPDNPMAASNLLLSLNYDPGGTAEEIFEAHKEWGIRIASRSPPALLTNGKEPDRPLRLAYLSSDFCRHPAAAFLEPVITHHDRTRFSVTCYSQTQVRDAVTERFRSLADGFHELTSLDDDAAERLIRKDGIDIIIDCTGHMAHNRLPLLARRCAPVQVSWIGYPSTTGLPTVDYRFTDDVTDPPGEVPPFTERLVRLTGGFCCYQPPEDAPFPSPPSSEHGRGITFGSLHTPARLTPAVIALWSSVLLGLPESRMLIFRTTLNDEITARITGEFGSRGIDSQRLEFRRTVPPAGHLSLYHEIDIALDTTPWNGHTTACEALWMGVPVISLLGERHAGRMVASVLTRLGLDELVADSPDEFAIIAKRLAEDSSLRTELRSSLRERMRESPLCDGPGTCRNLEREYRAMWRRWCGG